MTKRRIFVVEVTLTVQDDGDTATYLFGTHGFTTRPTDTPANTHVRPLLKNVGSIRRDVFQGARVTGPVRPSYGSITIANPASEGGVGELDDWIGYGISGGNVVVRWGEEGAAYPAAFSIVYMAKCHSFTADVDVITIKLRDDLQLLDVPLASEGFAGTGGIEGGSGGIGKRKRWVSETPGYLEVTLVDPIKLVYEVHHVGAFGSTDYLTNAGAITRLWDVYDNGIPLVRVGPDYTSSAQMLSSSPGSSEVRFWFGPASAVYPGWTNGPVYFRLGSPPEGDVRCFAIGVPTDADRARNNGTGASFTTHLLALRGGFQFADIDPESREIPVQNRATDGDDTINEVMADSCLAWHAYFGMTRLGKFRSGYLLDPNSENLYYATDDSIYGSPQPSMPSTSVYQFDQHTIKNLKREPINGMEAPIWQVVVNAGESTKSQLANGVDSTIKDRLSREPWYASFSGVSDSARIANPGAISASVDIKANAFPNSFARRVFLERYFVLYGGRRDVFTFTARMEDDQGLSLPGVDALLELELLDVVTLRHPRFGLADGKKFRIISIELNCSARTIKFGVWGGETGSYTGNASIIDLPGSGEDSTTAALRAAANSIGEFTGEFRGSVSIGGGGGGLTGGDIGEFTGEFRGSIAPQDPHWSEVLLLMNASGANTFDASPASQTLTVSGTVPINSVQQLFGQNTYELTASGNNRIVCSNIDFFCNPADDKAWTIEGWAYITSIVGTGDILLSSPFGASDTTTACTSLGGSSYTLTGGAMPLNQWVHWAFVRDKSDPTFDYLRRYINGVQVGISSFITKTDQVTNSGGFGWVLGRNNVAVAVGHHSQLRWTLGTCRYPGGTTFAIPTAPFPTY